MVDRSIRGSISPLLHARDLLACVHEVETRLAGHSRGDRGLPAGGACGRIRSGQLVRCGPLAVWMTTRCGALQAIWAARGKTDWEAAEILGSSHETIIQHLKHPRERHGVRNRAHLAVMALFDGSICLSDMFVGSPQMRFSRLGAIAPARRDVSRPAKFKARQRVM